MNHWTDRLVEMGACSNAVDWAKQYPTPLQAWKACERPDWMLWAAGKLARTQAERGAIVLAAAACARTALKYVPAGEPRPLAAIEAAERWAKDPTKENRADAGAEAEAAWAAARAAGAAGAAGDAAGAEAGAAWAEAGAAARAAWAAEAAEAAGDAAWAAGAAGDAANRKMADIVRQFVSIRQKP